MRNDITAKSKEETEHPARGAAPQATFATFIFKDPQNRKYLWIALGVMVIELIIFKFLYPFADYFSDSYYYVEAALNRLDINFWPVGYSKFLYVFHLLTHSDTALVAFQYLFAGFTLLLFFFTLLYWFRPSSTIANILFIFLFFNPLFLYLSNYISSDALFMALSVLWFTQLIWIIQRPRPWHLWTHALLIGIAFTIRYNAMYYPLITTLVFLLSRYSWRMKIAGIVLPVALIVAFVLYTREKAREITGTPQFSLFSGWQWANNALYMYPYIQVDSTQLPPQSIGLNKVVKNYFDKPPEQLKRTAPSGGSFFIWDAESPLKLYAKEHAPANLPEAAGLKKTIVSWGAASPLFGTYGSHLAKQHPMAYARYYILPNAVTYLIPPLETLKQYHMGRNELRDPIVKEWFDYKSMQTHAVSKNFQGALLFFFPSFFAILNLCLVASLIWFLILKGYKRTTRDFRYFLLMVSGFFVTNMGFSILASPVVFRYQIFPMIIYFAFCLLLFELFEKMYSEQLSAENTTVEPTIDNTVS